jgi:hypothetical protein
MGIASLTYPLWELALLAIGSNLVSKVTHKPRLDSNPCETGNAA